MLLDVASALTLKVTPVATGAVHVKQATTPWAFKISFASTSLGSFFLFLAVNLSGWVQRGSTTHGTYGAQIVLGELAFHIALCVLSGPSGACGACGGARGVHIVAGVLSKEQKSEDEQQAGGMKAGHG